MHDKYEEYELLALVPPSEEVKAKHSKGYGFN
jgi:hypothetical protein